MMDAICCLFSVRIVQTISDRYIELYEKLIGEKFIPIKLTDDEMEHSILNALKDLMR